MMAVAKEPDDMAVPALFLRLEKRPISPLVRRLFSLNAVRRNSIVLAARGGSNGSS